MEDFDISKNPTQAEKLLATNIKKYGSEEAWREHMKEIGRAGGKASKSGGWAYMKKHNPQRLKDISTKAGRVTNGRQHDDRVRDEGTAVHEPTQENET